MNNGVVLTTKQTLALDILEDYTSDVSEVIYGGSAGSAKTFIGCYWALKMCLKYPGIRGMLAREELKTLKRTTLVTFFEVCKIMGIKNDVHFRVREQIAEIHFYNGSVLLLQGLPRIPSDPQFDYLGSLEISFAFVDEIAQIHKEAWDILKTRIRYKLDEFGITPKLFGSLNPSKNWVYTYFYKPYVSGGLDTKKAFIRALPTDNPHLPQSYLNALNALPKPQRDRLYLGLWEATDDSQLTDTDKALEMFNNTWVLDDVSKHNYIVCDVARLGSDRAVIGYWEGLVLKEMYTYGKSTITELQTVISTLKNKYKVANANIIVDEDGVGGGLVDMLRCKGFVNNSTALNQENYQNLKTQCYYKLADYINGMKIYIDFDMLENDKQSLMEEVEQIRVSPTDDNKLRLISKDEVKSNIGRSPDLTDMFAMRMYYEINKNNGIYNLI